MTNLKKWFFDCIQNIKDMAKKVMDWINSITKCLKKAVLYIQTKALDSRKNVRSFVCFTLITGSMILTIRLVYVTCTGPEPLRYQIVLAAFIGTFLFSVARFYLKFHYPDTFVNHEKLKNDRLFIDLEKELNKQNPKLRSYLRFLIIPLCLISILTFYNIDSVPPLVFLVLLLGFIAYLIQIRRIRQALRTADLPPHMWPKPSKRRTAYYRLKMSWTQYLAELFYGPQPPLGDDEVTRKLIQAESLRRLGYIGGGFMAVAIFYAFYKNFEITFVEDKPKTKFVRIYKPHHMIKDATEFNTHHYWWGRYASSHKPIIQKTVELAALGVNPNRLTEDSVRGHIDVFKLDYVARNLERIGDNPQARDEFIRNFNDKELSMWQDLSVNEEFRTNYHRVKEEQIRYCQYMVEFNERRKLYGKGNEWKDNEWRQNHQ